MSDKKKFKDTKVGQWLKKAGQHIPEIAAVGLEIATGDLGGAVEKVSEILGNKAQTDQKAKELLLEWRKYKMDFERELIAMENADRADARAREVAVVSATGKRDWMQALVGIIGLGLLVFLVVVGVFFHPTNKDVFHQVLGIVEGVALAVFGYFYGTSKGSKEKQDIISGLRK